MRMLDLKSICQPEEAFAMVFVKMLRSAAILSAVCFFGANAPSTWAQDNGTDGPPKILVIQREFLKPGRNGAVHVKSEAGFIHALANAKATPRYLAMTSLSGASRALFFSGYPSLSAWEEESKSVYTNAALAAAMDRVNLADGDLLSEFDQSVWSRRDDLSFNMGNLQGDRYMELIQFVVRPGHMHQWEELVKMVQAGYKKGLPDANWATFQMLYGNGGNAFLVVTKLKSLAEADQNLASDSKFADAMGEDGMQKLEELEAACIESRQTNLFAFSPEMSYPPDAWTKAEPDYWKQPKVAPAAKKAAQ
jgi:hypothetical protein